MDKKIWNIYLAGEIHSNWREKIIKGAQDKELEANFTFAVTNHEASDLCGVRILGEESQDFWRDRKGAGVNAIRISNLIRQADIVIVRFGTKYRQWNAAFDAGFAVALNKSIIILHDKELDHALKEVDGAANATARTPEQVVDILSYVIAQ